MSQVQSKIIVGTSVRIMQNGHIYNGWTGVVFRIDVGGYEPYCIKLKCGKYVWAKQIEVLK